MKTLKRLLFLFLVLLGFAAPMAANAQTDIAAVTDTVSGYSVAAIALAITILLFVVGRGVVRKIIR